MTHSFRRNNWHITRASRICDYSHCRHFTHKSLLYTSVSQKFFDIDSYAPAQRSRATCAQHPPETTPYSAPSLCSLSYYSLHTVNCLYDNAFWQYKIIIPYTTYFHDKYRERNVSQIHKVANKSVSIVVSQQTDMRLLFIQTLLEYLGLGKKIHITSSETFT